MLSSIITAKPGATRLSLREGAVAHTVVVTEHLARLGLTINDAKSGLILVQCTTYLGLRLDSTTAGSQVTQGFQQGSQVDCSPEWSLDIVLEALTKALYEPIYSIELKYLSTKTAFIVVIISAKRVSELQALSVHGSCMRIWDQNQSVELESSYPPPFFSEENKKLNFL
ncbi:UNVERIFIED_CONTAM: hypothetical protein FKN15_066306 [Acipenser sinensis]